MQTGGSVMKDFFESGLGHFLRWILFIPLSFVAYLLCVFISNIFLYLSGTYMDWGESMFSYLFRHILSNGFGGYVFVYSGSMIVPYFNKIVSVILAILFLVFSVLAIIGGTLLGTFFGDGVFEGWVDILAICASIVGSGYASFIFLTDQQDSL